MVPREGFEPPTARFLPEGPQRVGCLYPPGLTTAGRSTAELPGAKNDFAERVIRIVLWLKWVSVFM